MTLLNKNKNKFSYGRQVRLSRLNNEKIKLPSVENGEKPDWKYMENFIKLLSFSKNI